MLLLSQIQRKYQTTTESRTAKKSSSECLFAFQRSLFGYCTGAWIKSSINSQGTSGIHEEFCNVLYGGCKNKSEQELTLN